MIYVIGPRDRAGDGKVIMTVSKVNHWTRGLSPFILGPCQLYNSFISRNMENAWQFCKLYKCHADSEGNPTKEYWEWAEEGWANEKAIRYPMGKGTKPLYSLWDGKKLDYIGARKQIYIPLYYNVVKNSNAFQLLKEEYATSIEDLYLWDFDGYNHKKMNMTYDDVVHCREKKMGHAFILAMMLEGYDKYLIERKEK